MKKKISIVLFLLIILITNLSLASYSNSIMTVPEEPVCTISLTEKSTVERKLITKDLTTKELTMQLTVTNNEVSVKPTGELMVVLDNSKSMTDEVEPSVTREDLIIESANTLITNLLKNNNDLKIGVVSFSTNVEQTKEGTIEDAMLVSDFTSDASTLKSAIENIQYTGPRTDLEAGVTLASGQFTSSASNKYMIILTDGVPNIALGKSDKWYSDEVIQSTKEKLKSLETSNINVITMLSGINDETEIPINNTKNLGEIIEEIFGTQSEPTIGKFYYVQDEDIEKTITTDIYNELVPSSSSLKDIVVTDYLSEEIYSNFDFSYVKEPSMGTITPNVDTEKYSITWTIPDLPAGQTATVQYKLKLKENYSPLIVSKVLNTNSKLDVNFTNLDDTTVNKSSTITPKVKLTEPPTVLPKAGITFMIGFAVVAVVGIVFYFKYKKIKNI